MALLWIVRNKLLLSLNYISSIYTYTNTHVHACTYMYTHWGEKSMMHLCAGASFLVEVPCRLQNDGYSRVAAAKRRLQNI